MTASTLLILSAVAMVLGLAVFFCVPALRAYRTFHGKRIITCPETHKPAAVEVAAGKAARTGILGDPTLRLKQCSRWPERQDCGQECLQQVETDPENCLVWNIVSNWYEGKQCVFCHKPFGQMRHFDHPPALLALDGTTTEWKDFKPEQLPDVFSRFEAVCWDCHMTQGFRRVHPELVVDRNWHQ